MNSPIPLTVQVSLNHPGVTVIRAAGDLDLANAARLRSALAESIALGDVVLETDGVTFCDSSGLRILVEARRLAESKGCAFRLAAASRAVTRVLELADAAALFEAHPDVETALRGL